MSFGLKLKRFQSYHFYYDGQIPKQSGRTRRNLYRDDSLNTQILFARFAHEVFRGFICGCFYNGRGFHNTAFPNVP